MSVARRAMALGAVVVLLATACRTGSASPAPDSYPLPKPPPSQHLFLPAQVGTPVWAVVLGVRIRAGDRIEILSVDPIGKVTGADVAFFVAPQTQPGMTFPPGAPLEPIQGAVLTNTADGGETAMGIAAELTPHNAGRFELIDIRLSFRINDGIAEQGTGISATLAVCAGDETCGP